MLMHKKIHKHFQTVDPVLFRTLRKIKEPEDIVASRDLFTDLCDAIISQQLSNKVAAILVERLKILLGGAFSPHEIITTSDDDIRKQGISYAKIASLKDLSNRLIQKELEFESLSTLPNDEVVSRLIQVRGIGPWTAEMFLMFSLGREDVFSAGDGGLKRAIKQLYGFKQDPTKEEMLALSEKWAPYRTYACRILWRSLDI